MKIGGLQKLTLIDYPGKVACTIFLSGCNFRCHFCYSKELVLPEEIKKHPQILEKEVFDFLKERKGMLEGACLSVAGDEPVIIRNDKVLKHLSIEKLWDKTKPISFRINPIPHEYKKINFECLTKDGFKKAKEIIRHKTKKLYKIIASPGNYNVKLTGGHSIFVLTKKGLEVKKVNRIKKGDFLLSANSGIINHSFHLKTIDIISYLPEVFNFSKDWIITKTYIRNKFSNVKIKIPRKILITKQFCEFLGYAVAEGSTRYRYSESKKKNPSGYQFSLGNELKLAKKILRLYRDIFRSNTGWISKEMAISGKSKYNIIVGNRLIAQFIQKLVGEGFIQKHIPDIIFNATKENKVAFLKALVEGDGHQRTREKKSQQEFSIKTSSPQLAADTVFLANSLGVFSWVEEIKGDKQRKKSFRVALSSNDLEKIRIKKEIKTKYSFNTRVKGIPMALVDYALRGQKRINVEKLKKWIDLSDISKEKKRVGIRFNFLTKDGKISERTKRIQFLYNLIKNWDIKEIKSIKKIQLKSPQYAYDLVVPGNHSFVGGVGSFLLHNTGGEPTIHKELPSFIKKIKDMGFLVKLDTNGSNPKMLETLIKERLVDYVAMDIKVSKEKYERTVNVKVDTKKINESVDILKKGKIDFEFRTTVVPTIHKKEDFLEIAKWIGGNNVKYYLQNFRAEKTIDKKFEDTKPFEEDFLKEIIKEISPYFKECKLR